jgi:hypothetical protein
MTKARRTDGVGAIGVILLALAGCAQTSPSAKSAGRQKPPPPDIPAPMATPDGPGVGVAEKPVRLKQYHFRRTALGVDFNIDVYAADSKSAEAGVEGAMQRVTVIEQALDPARQTRPGLDLGGGAGG